MSDVEKRTPVASVHADTTGVPIAAALVPVLAKGERECIHQIRRGRMENGRFREFRSPCVRPLGHKGKHADGWGEW